MSEAKTRQAVDTLLAMYQAYKRLNEQAEQTGRQLVKAKLRGDDTTSVATAYETLRTELQQLSDAMTFAGPTIWAMYKFEAYADEAQPIRTMHDFRMHCSKPGYICTKRFQYVNSALARRNLPTLADKAVFPDSMLVSELYASLKPLEADAAFMQAWSGHEYYRKDGVVAKWERA